MRSPESVSGTSVDSVRQRRELLVARSELERVRRKLTRSERALESLTIVLSLVPDPIEVVAPDHTVLFANRASRLLHENEQLEGTPYYQSVMGLDEPPVECPIRRATEDDRETAYTAACDNGEVYEVAVTPIVLSDGRRAAMCFSKPVVAGGVVADALEVGRVDSDVSRDRVETAEESPTAASHIADVSSEWEDEEKRLLQKIAQLSSSTLDAVLAQVTDGVLMTNTRCEPILFNNAFRELTGFDGSDPASLFGILFPHGKAGTSPTGVFDDLDALTKKGKFETDIVRGDGERVTVEMAVSRIPREGDDDTAVLFSFRDLRETREIKDQLIEALNLSLAGERIASLAHQVNNYLTPAFYHTDQLAQRKNLDRKTQQSVTTIQNYLNLCHESILMVLSLIRPAVPTAINMNHLIAEVFSKHYLAEDLRLDNIEIVQRYDPAMVETMGYRVLLQQALANIIKNAQEAMVQNERSGGRLMVLTEATPTTITIRISDNGPGIPKDIQDKIFDLLFTSKGASKGSGIGLHFTKEVIAKHGGTITVESQLNEGAVFEIRLPVRPPEDIVETANNGDSRRTERIESARRQPTKSVSGRVLVIDDEPGILDLLSDILVAQDHLVTTSADANDALQKIQSNEYDCIICDIRMPEVDGRELSQLIKEHDRNLYHRLVFITGDIFNRETDDFIRQTGIPCLEKPFTTDQVHDVVQGVLTESNDSNGKGGAARTEPAP